MNGSPTFVELNLGSKDDLLYEFLDGRKNRGTTADC